MDIIAVKYYSRNTTCILICAINFPIEREEIRARKEENLQLEKHRAEALAEARKKAVLDAKKKAEDYVSALNQKVGKAVLISDSSNAFHYGKK